MDETVQVNLHQYFDNVNPRDLSSLEPSLSYLIKPWTNATRIEEEKHGSIKTSISIANEAKLLLLPA